MNLLLGAASLLLTAAGFTASGAGQQDLGDAALVEALRGGGYVLVMRHAHAPEALPGEGETDRANHKRERQLDATGQASAQALAKALQLLHLPIGTVWSSPTYRALETVRLSGLPAPSIADELGDGGQSMQPASSAQAAWLRAHANQEPRSGTDTVVVTQYPNIVAAFGDRVTGMKDGEALVFRPTRGALAQLVGRISIERWQLMVLELPSHRKGPK